MTWPGDPDACRSTFRRADDDFQGRLWREDEISTEACPGFDRCHGPHSWCDECGDVRNACHCIECHKHRCRVCRDVVPYDENDDAFDWARTCATCSQTIAQTR